MTSFIIISVLALIVAAFIRLTISAWNLGKNYFHFWLFVCLQFAGAMILGFGFFFSALVIALL